MDISVLEWLLHYTTQEIFLFKKILNFPWPFKHFLFKINYSCSSTLTWESEKKSYCCINYILKILKNLTAFSPEQLFISGPQTLTWRNSFKIKKKTQTIYSVSPSFTQTHTQTPNCGMWHLGPTSLRTNVMVPHRPPSNFCNKNCICVYLNHTWELVTDCKQSFLELQNTIN